MDKSEQVSTMLGQRADADITKSASNVSKLPQFHKISMIIVDVPAKIFSRRKECRRSLRRPRE